MKLVLQWIVLVWTVLAAVWALTTSEMPWDETIYSLIYSGLVFGLIVNAMRNEEKTKQK